MPFDMMPYEEQVAKHGFVPMDHHKPNYFPVLEGEVFNASGKKLTGYKMLERGDTGDTLAVHSSSYRVISDETIFNAFDSALNVSGLDLNGLMVAADTSHDGARMFVQYVLPAVTREIAGEPVSLRFLMWNSYDGSRAASGRVGFFNWVCANTAVRGKTLDIFSVKHIGNADNNTAPMIETKISALVDGAVAAKAELELMDKWPKIRVLDATAIEVFEAIPASSKRLVADMNMIWTADSNAKGGNLWTLYNTLTGWATHTNTKSNRANVCVERQERIAKTMAAKPFSQLMALAA